MRHVMPCFKYSEFYVGSGIMFERFRHFLLLPSPYDKLEAGSPLWTFADLTIKKSLAQFLHFQLSQA